MLTKTPMNKQPKSLSLIEKFTCMINKFNQIEKGAWDYGTGILLYPSEIHLIELIGKNPGINANALNKNLVHHTFIQVEGKITWLKPLKQTYW